MPASPNRAETEYHLANDIDSGKQRFAVFQQIKGFIGKRGKGGEPAKQPGNKQGARGSGQDAVCFREEKKKTDRETAGDIYRKGTHRKKRRRHHFLNGTADKIPQNRAAESADSDEKNTRNHE